MGVGELVCECTFIVLRVYVYVNECKSGDKHTFHELRNS